jgi:glutaredoxin-like protein NrdH
MITVYGKPQCPECDRAKNILNSNGVEYKYVDISKDEIAMQFILGLKLRSLPQCFDEESHIGGADDLSFYLSF